MELVGAPSCIITPLTVTLKPVMYKNWHIKVFHHRLEVGHGRSTSEKPKTQIWLPSGVDQERYNHSIVAQTAKVK